MQTYNKELNTNIRMNNNNILYLLLFLSEYFEYVFQIHLTNAVVFYVIIGIRFDLFHELELVGPIIVFL